MWSPNFISSHPILMVYICAWALVTTLKFAIFNTPSIFEIIPDTISRHIAGTEQVPRRARPWKKKFFNTELSWEGHLSNKKPHCQTLPKLKRSWGGGKDDGVSDEGVLLASFEELDSGVLYFENVSSAFSAAGKTKNKDGVRNVKVKIDWGKNIKLGTG